MAELDNIPQSQTVEIATVKLDDALFDQIKEANQKLNNLVIECGSLYIRKREMEDELIKIADMLEANEQEVKATNIRLNDIASDIDDQYPQARINVADGTVQYQPGAPTRKQQQQQQVEQQQQQSGGQSFANMKVVKE